MSTAVVAEGILSSTGLGHVTLPAEWTLDDVAAAARGTRSAAVYVADRAGHDRPRCEAERSLDWTVSDGVPWPWRYTLPSSEAGGRVEVVDLAADTARVSGPWVGLTPRQLWKTFGRLEALLGVPWGSSAGQTVEALILSTHPKARGGTLLDVEPRTPDPARSAALELPYTGWRREPTRDERSSYWVHAYDANAQYLAAWGAVELGFGTPVHYARPTFDQRHVGLWRVPELPHNPEPMLPAPWLGGRREWFTTATVARMLEYCEGFDAPLIAEAWLWPRKSRFLRPAGERLRDARARALVTIGAARLRRDDDGVDELVVADTVKAAVKDVYARGTGRFNMGARAETSGWARPDWGHAVRATARCNLHRRLHRLTRYPFAIDVDGLLFVTDEPDPVKFAETIGLPLGIGLGQYRHDNSAPATPVFEALDEAGRGLRSVFRAVYQNRV